MSSQPPSQPGTGHTEGPTLPFSASRSCQICVDHGDPCNMEQSSSFSKCAACTRFGGRCIPTSPQSHTAWKSEIHFDCGRCATSQAGPGSHPGSSIASWSPYRSLEQESRREPVPRIVYNNHEQPQATLGDAENRRQGSNSEASSSEDYRTVRDDEGKRQKQESPRWEHREEHWATNQFRGYEDQTGYKTATRPSDSPYTTSPASYTSSTQYQSYASEPSSSYYSSMHSSTDAPNSVCFVGSRNFSYPRSYRPTSGYYPRMEIQKIGSSSRPPPSSSYQSPQPSSQTGSISKYSITGGDEDESDPYFLHHPDSIGRRENQDDPSYHNKVQGVATGYRYDY